MHERSKDRCSPKYDYRSGKGSPHSHGNPVDVVPTTAGIPSTLNLLPRYYREFQPHFRGNTRIPQIYRKYHYRVTLYYRRPHFTTWSPSRNWFWV